MADAMVTVTSLPSIHAAIVAGALQTEGIEVTLDRPALGSVYAFEQGVWATRVQVPAADAERAMAILEAIEEQEV